MRGLTFALIASCILWCLLTWCTVYTCTLSAGLSDLLASLSFIGLSIIVIRFSMTCFDDHEPDDRVARDRPVD